MAILVKYKKSLIVSIALHVLVLTALLVQFSRSVEFFTPMMLQQTKPVKIVEATSIDAAQVQAEIAKIESSQQKKQQSEQAELRRLQQQQAEAKKALDTLKVGQQNALQKQRDERQRAEAELAKLKQQQAEAKKQAEQLKQQQADANKQLQEAKRQAEQAKKQQALEKEKLAALERQKQQAIAEQKKKQAEQQRLADQMFDKQLADEEMLLKSSRQGYVDKEVAKYIALIIQAISQQWIIPNNSDPNLSSMFSLKMAPSGAVLAVELVKSSGNPVFDRSVRTAIFKATPLPVPKDPELFAVFRDVRLTVRPEGYLIES